MDRLASGGVARLVGALPVAGAMLLVAGYAALLAQPWIAYGQGWLLGADGRPLPSDFAALRVAGDFALRGDAGAAYDWSAFNAAVSAFIGSGARHWLGWLNPPIFFLVVAPLALLPFQTAGFVWLGASGAAYLAAARHAFGSSAALLFALAAPAAFACVAKGQSGFLSAALLGFGLTLPDRRPILAGLWIGLLAYKPQLGLVLPVLLAAGGHWRCIAVAGATVAVLILLSGSLFGWDSWLAFFGSLGGTTDQFLLQGAGRAAMQSIYSLAMSAGLRPGVAAALHAVVALGALAVAVTIWRMRPAPEAARAAAGIAAAFLATPYVFNHDAPMLVIAALLLAGRNSCPRATIGECGWLCVATLVPIVTLMTPTNLPGCAAAMVILAVARRQACRASS